MKLIRLFFLTVAVAFAVRAEPVDFTVESPVDGNVLKCSDIPGKFGRTTRASIEQYNLQADKIAIKGYDPVAYFTRNTATKGLPELKAEYLGVTYQFSSSGN